MSVDSMAVNVSGWYSWMIGWYNGHYRQTRALDEHFVVKRKNGVRAADTFSQTED